MKKLLLLLMMIFALCGCEKKPPTPDELYATYRESVVLIKNVYFHKVILDNGMEFYFVEGSEGIQLFDNVEEATANASVSFGTGFFIDSEGKIATNRHVVYPEGNDLVFQNIDAYFIGLKDEILKDYEANSERMENLSNYYNTYNSYLDYTEKSDLESEYAELQNENEMLEEIFPQLEYDKKFSKIELVRLDLSIAYDNTFVENAEDFESCVPVKKSEKEEIDLAIIQLNKKRTPSYITHYFKVPSVDNLPEIKMSESIYMIGYNHGISLAVTEEGVKSQFTTGNITQDPDSDRILYSIPTLQGSSGSPIFNSWGELIAINFAKTRDYQGFSFGIPVKNLIQLYQDLPLTNSEIQVAAVSEDEVLENISTTSSKGARDDYSNRIRGLIEAEERRNFEEITTYFSKDLVRYWNVSYPTREELYKQYSDSWGLVLNSSNRILEIEKLNKFNYILHTEYRYTLRESREVKTIKSKVRFKFNDNGEIVEVYGN